MFDVSSGDVMVRQARFIALWWDARSIPEQHDADLELVASGAPSESGVYAVTGRHDSQSGTGVLYIGKATQLCSRVPRSIRDCLSEMHADSQRVLYSDVWDLTVRWARLSSHLLDAAERLLIMS